MEETKIVDRAREIPEVESVEVARLRPGDVVVLTAKERLSSTAIEWIQKFAKDVFPNNKVIVLDNGMTMKIARADDGHQLEGSDASRGV